MPKKKPQRNGLYWFMQDLVPELRREGRAIPNGMADVVPIALPRWKALTQADRDRYEHRAKEEKKKTQNSREADKYRLDNMGNVIADRLDPVKELASRRIRESRIARSRWPSGDDFLDHKFYLIAFEYKFKTKDLEFLPAEVGMVEFSLRYGITKCYHKFVDARMADGRPFPMGYRYTCQQHSDDTHQIPIQNFDEATDDYRGICIQIENFVNPSGEKREYPPLYCLGGNLECTEYCMQWLYSQSRLGQASPLQKIYELENLVVDLFGQCQQQFEHTSAIALLTGSAFDYELNVRCKWHEEKDCKFCALATVRKFCYALGDSLSNHFEYELTPNHLPERVEVASSARIPTSSLKLEDKRKETSGSVWSSQLENTTGSGTFASRDIRYADLAKRTLYDDSDSDNNDGESGFDEDFPGLGNMTDPSSGSISGWPVMRPKDRGEGMISKPSLATRVGMEADNSQKRSLGEAVKEKEFTWSKPSLGQAVQVKETTGMGSGIARGHALIAGGRVAPPVGRGGVAGQAGPPVGRGAGRGRGNMATPRLVNAPGTIFTGDQGASRTEIAPSIGRGKLPAQGAPRVVNTQGPPFNPWGNAPQAAAPPVVEPETTLRQPRTMPRALDSALLAGMGLPSSGTDGNQPLLAVGRGRGGMVGVAANPPAPGKAKSVPVSESVTRPPPGFGRGILS